MPKALALPSTRVEEATAASSTKSAKRERQTLRYAMPMRTGKAVALRRQNSKASGSARVPKRSCGASEQRWQHVRSSAVGIIDRSEPASSRPTRHSREWSAMRGELCALGPVDITHETPGETADMLDDILSGRRPTTMSKNATGARTAR